MEKKMRNLVGKFASLFVVTTLCASSAFAGGDRDNNPTPVDPGCHSLKIAVSCPVIGDPCGASTVVQNYGTYLAGDGTIKINNDAPTHPLFQGPILPGLNIPTNLSTYSNNGATYNPVDGAVICKYKSSQAGNDPFSISYIMQNASNGVVTSSTADKINIVIHAGLKK